MQEGYQNLPIDIQTSKLLDWLVDRRHCNLKWQSAALEIRRKINAAIQDMPENEEIKQLLSGSYIHYFHCLRIIEVLKGTEASTKNIFGRYSSQRMKDWQEIVWLYEKDNVYLAEIASQLVRNVTYEIPSLKKQISKFQQLQQEFSRKETDCVNHAADLRNKFYASCKQYGITGQNVKQELLALVKDLPSSLSSIGEEIESLSEPIRLYQACVQFVCDTSEEVEVLPLLRHIQTKGNTTVYEWRTGFKPSEIESPESVQPRDVVESNTEEMIDWGDFGGETTTASDGIDYGISIESGDQSDGIDWGISLEPSTMEADLRGGTDGIDWGDAGTSPVEIEIVESGSQAKEQTSQGMDYVLDYRKPRHEFVFSLTHLEIFLSQRAVELSEEADVLSVSQFQLAPPILQAQSKEAAIAMVTAVKDLIDRLTNLKMQHLFLIHASPRYVDRVDELLRQQLKQADLLLEKQQTAVRKRQEALKEQAALEPKLDLLIQRTKEQQKLIEADVSKRYSNRPVNLMGVSI
uniref:CDK5 regulatory subunit associated protein 3 n=1 Tax=Latimeria chalumnae TaxID=7897 RepID=H3AGD9_LATCH